jgi:serine/threonine-protein kinase
MSPEQCEAKRELTGSSDQYSLGIVAYELLTGHTPFQAETTLGLLFAHVHEPPPPPGPDVPPHVAEALLRMLEKDPAKRFPDVEAAIAALGGGPVANDDPVREQLRQLARAGAADDVRRIASTPVSPLPATRSRPAPTAPKTAARPGSSPPVTPGKRRSPFVWAVPLVLLVAAGAAAVFVLGGRSKPPAEPPTTTAAAPTPPTPSPQPLSMARPETVRIEVPVPTPAETVTVNSPKDSSSAPSPDGRGGQGERTARRRFTAAQVGALAIRTRARNRGADPAALREGDVTARRADSLARAGDYAAATATLREAQQQWTEAAGAPGGVAPTSDRAEVENVVANFAAAFASRDLSRVRRAYPGMTPAQAQEWGTFFLDARNLEARLEVTSFEQHDDGGSAQLTGGLDWESVQSGRAESRTVSYRATLTRDRSGWRLTSLR